MAKGRHRQISVKFEDISGYNVLPVATFFIALLARQWSAGMKKKSIFQQEGEKYFKVSAEFYAISQESAFGLENRGKEQLSTDNCNVVFCTRKCAE